MTETTVAPPVLRTLVRGLGTPPPSSARDRQRAELGRRLGWAAPAGAALATIAAAAGAALRDGPSVFSALALAAVVATAHFLVRGLAARVRQHLEAAVGECEGLEAELAAAGRTKQELRNLADHDGLTGLPNRGLLFDRLGLALAHSRRQASHIALLFLDIDDFKAVNDSFGHAFGDRVLVGFAARVRGTVRAGDTVARLGGDEFVVLLDSVTGAGDAAHVAAKVLDAVRVPFQLDGHALTIAASVGVSVYPGDGTSPDELLGSADAAMYRDKQREPPRGVI